MATRLNTCIPRFRLGFCQFCAAMRVLASNRGLPTHFDELPMGFSGFLISFTPQRGMRQKRVCPTPSLLTKQGAFSGGFTRSEFLPLCAAKDDALLSLTVDFCLIYPFCLKDKIMYTYCTYRQRFTIHTTLIAIISIYYCFYYYVFFSLNFFNSLIFI